MDKIDKKIITLLQQNARMPLKALAENVFLSSPAVSARIERLEKEEIIEGYEVKINQLKLGYHITAFINLEVAPVQKPEFYPFIKTCPNVVECNCVTGNYSMLLRSAIYKADGISLSTALAGNIIIIAVAVVLGMLLFDRSDLTV